MTAGAVSAGRLPRRLLLAGAAGSVLVAVGGVGAGALPRPDPDRGWLGITVLASTATTRSLSTALAVVGVVLLVGAWWRTRRVLDGLAPSALIRATAVWSLPLLVAPPMFSRDVYAYAGQALVAARSLDPYDAGPSAVGGDVAANVDDVWLDTPSPYGPAFLGPASLVLRGTGDDVVPAVLLLRLLAVLGLVLTAWALPRLARACGVPAQRALWLGLANPLGLLHGVAGAHNDALMVGLLVTGLALALRPPPRPPEAASSDASPDEGRDAPRSGARHWGMTRPSTPTLASWQGLVAAGAVVALAGLVKAPALAALPFLVLAVPGVRARVRAGVALAAGAVATAIAVTLASGLGWGWLSTLTTGRERLSLFSPTTGLGVAVGQVLEAVGAVDDAADAREAVLAIGVLAALAVSAGLLLRVPRLGAVQALGLALLVVVVLSPTVQAWYVLWGVVLLAAVVGPRTAAALGAACLVLCLTVWPGGRSVVRPPLYGVPLVAAAVAAAVVWRRAAVEAGDRAPAANS